jgi:DNA-binding HxlR family transcriptional regulator
MEANTQTTGEIKHRQEECKGALLPVRDALEVLNGHWKLQVLIALSGENMRFGQISKAIPGITDKMLSKELKELEANKLVVRTVFGTFPPTVEYAITEHGQSLWPVITALRDWGMLHRKKVIGK